MPDIKKIERPEDITDALMCNKAVIFKHSTRCPVSADARMQVEEFAKTCDESIVIFMVDVIADRGLSDEIEKRTEVAHHSPQVIFIHDKQVTGTETHWRITQESLSRGIQESDIETQE